jgi:hypothetical protein
VDVEFAAGDYFPTINLPSPSEEDDPRPPYRRRPPRFVILKAAKDRDNVPAARLRSQPAGFLLAAYPGIDRSCDLTWNFEENNRSFNRSC